MLQKQSARDAKLHLARKDRVLLAIALSLFLVTVGYALYLGTHNRIHPSAVSHSGDSDQPNAMSAIY
jgi:hypothetical protein